jgi:hypothetical protein
MSALALRNLRSPICRPNHLYRSPFSSTTSLLIRSTRLSSTATSVVEKPRSSVNGPLSTHPAPLTLPTREPNQSFFPKHALALGKAYLAFYKTGVKNVYYNMMNSFNIYSRLDKLHKSSVTNAIKANDLSRCEFQLLERSKFDLKRVPVFALVFLVCGEFTPLVVIALSGVVPWTCRIPKQVDGDRKKLETRRAISFRNLTLPPPKDEGVDGLQRMQLLHISWSLGLCSSVWDWLGGQLPGLPTPLLRRRVRRRVEYLKVDDELIMKEGGVKGMDPEEVKMACVERGIDVLGKGDGELKRRLSQWLHARQKAGIERLLLTR